MKSPPAEDSHRQTTIAQFTKQAAPFARNPSHSLKISRLVDLAEVSPEHNVLDVACGPGLVAMAFATRAATVIGVDLTPEMLRQASQAASEAGHKNIRFLEGSADALPFPDAAFDTVVSRYAFHHLESHSTAFAEMVRVCRPGGVILIADMTVSESCSQEFNNWERLRDPSHRRALTQTEFEKLFARAHIKLDTVEHYVVPIDLDQQLADSHPNPGDGDLFRVRISEDIGRNALGIEAHRQNGRIHYRYPIAVFKGCR